MAALVVLFAKRPDAFYRPQFWAEDFIFLTAAQQQGLASLVTPQAGYLHLIPRLIALPASILRPELQPALFCLGSLVVLLAVFCLVTSDRLNLPFRPLLAAALILVPNTGEVFFNPTNAQWIAALGLAATALKEDPRRWADWITDVATIVIAGLSGPFILFALPLFVARAWRQPSRPSVTLLAIATAASLIQISFMAAAGNSPELQGPFETQGLAATISLRVPVTLFLGHWPASALAPAGMIVLGTALVLLILFGLRCRTDAAPTGDDNNRAARYNSAALVVFAAIVLAAGACRVRFDLWLYPDLYNGDRYFFIPKVILLWTAVAGSALAPRRWMRAVLALFLPLSVLANVPAFQFQRYTDDGWYDLCPEIRAGHPVEITINPGWSFRYSRGASGVVVQRR